MSNSLWPHALQHARLSCPSLSLRVWSNSCPLSWWCYLTIWSSASSFSFCLQSFPASGSSPMSQLFTSGGQSFGALAYQQSFQRIFRVYFPSDWLVWSPCSPRNSQQSSPEPQFKRSNSAVSFLYGSALTSIHDYQRNHSYDYTDLCQQSDVSVI